MERKLVEGGKIREWKEGTKAWNGKETESVAWEGNREMRHGNGEAGKGWEVGKEWRRGK